MELYCTQAVERRNADESTEEKLEVDEVNDQGPEARRNSGATADDTAGERDKEHEREKVVIQKLVQKDHEEAEMLGLCENHVV